MSHDAGEVDDTAMVHGGTPDPLAAVSQRRRHGVLVTAAAVAALGLSLGSAAVAGAGTTTTAPSASSGRTGAAGRPPFGGSPPAAVGTVASVGTDTFTLTARDGTTVTVHVSSSTAYADAGATSPTIASVRVGEHVAVFGTDVADVVTATRVAIGEPPSGAGPGGPGGHGGGGTPPTGAAGGLSPRSDHPGPGSG